MIPTVALPEHPVLIKEFKAWNEKPKDFDLFKNI